MTYEKLLGEIRESVIYMNDFAIRILTAPLGKTHLFSVGQAGFIIKSASGQLLGIDLYLSECVQRVEGHVGFKRLLPKILTPSDLRFDYLIATHPHYDHFDPDSIPQLMDNPKTELFASVECEKEASRLLMTGERCHYVKPGDCVRRGDFTLEFVNCDHGTGAPDAVGVIVTVDGKRIYEAGDTCLHLDRTAEYLLSGKIDVLIAPINGAYGNMNEAECAQFANALNAGITIPCHYGMFASHGGNPGAFYRIMKEQYPSRRFVLMAMGEELTL